MKSFAALVFSCLFAGAFLFPDVHNGFINPENGNIWAVLVAGSDTWSNYRHQADICHAYQVLHNHGVPDDNIIVMMKDDLSQNPENPTPGVVINHPNGADVYHGVLKDYTGEDVTPENFMAVMKGDQKSVVGIGSGRVLKSGPNDNVFVYFADHGAPGLIAFPESELTAEQLNNTISYMHRHSMYKKMVIYIEACESGSMFQNVLPNNINVFATTAANPTESSYACYYDNDRQTYLGDVYSVNWLEDSDKEDLAAETLQKQFNVVKKETNTSQVKEYGDLTIGKMHVSEFQGRKEVQPTILQKAEKRSVRNRDTHIEIVKRKIDYASAEWEKEKFRAVLEQMRRDRSFLAEKVREYVKEAVKSDAHVTDIMTRRRELNDFDCYEVVRDYFQRKCFKLSKNHYALEFMYVLVNLCEQGVSPRQQLEAMDKVCTHALRYGIH